jgi:hypothetical protein
LKSLSYDVFGEFACFDTGLPAGIVKNMRTPLLLSMALVLSWTMAGIAAPERSAEILLLGGTVVSIDQETSSVTLQMPSGESRLFAAIDRRLLQGISIGDHVTFQLNEEGKMTKLVKLPTDPAN